MKLYHQMGHNFVWNIQSLRDDGVGDGYIVSPVNISSGKISDRLSTSSISESFFDPQFYLPDDPKSKLETYSFFPSNVVDDFSTSNFEEQSHEIAKRCIEFQSEMGFAYNVIPTRYYDNSPASYLSQLSDLIVDPFIAAHQPTDDASPLLLTVIAKPSHLEGTERTELLTWATNYPSVDGIYLIFENDFRSKQIKDPDYLKNQLMMIHDIRMNDMEVHVGYTDVEGLLLSIADPSSITVGSYENLRSFGTRRLETRERSTQQGPRPRIYSGHLLQWIESNYLSPLRNLVPDWNDLFNESPHLDYLLDQDNTLNFQRKEIYRHYFYVLEEQVKRLPESVSERPSYIRGKVQEAIILFEKIEESGVFLDSDSDGSHLPAWMNAIAMYENSI